ncbi:MAG: MMPL family transporter, partial [Bacteriovoracaceae bacterium]
MKKAFNRFQEFCVSFIMNSPGKTLGAFFFFTIALGLGITQLKTDFTYKVWYNDNDPLMNLYQEFEKNFGNDDSVIVGVYSKDGIFTKESFQLIDELTNDLYQVDNITRVDSILNFHDIKASGDEIDIQPLVPEGSIEELSRQDLQNIKLRALNIEILQGSLVNKAGDFAIINAQVRPAHDNPPDYQKMTERVDAVLNKYKNKSPQIQLMATGPVILTDAFRSITLSDMALLGPVLYGIFTLILIFLYRRVSGVLLPYAAITFCSVMMLGTMGFLGLSINTLTAAAPTILMTVALADAIHILTVYYLAKRNNFTSDQALKRTLNKNFYPTLLTTITTALGFLSFFDAKVKPVAELGVAVGIGAVYAWFSAYALLGPLLAYLPRFEKKSEEAVSKHPMGVEREIIPAQRSYKFADWILKHKILILVCAFLSGLGGLYFAKNLVVNMDPTEQFPAGH